MKKIDELFNTQKNSTPQEVFENSSMDMVHLLYIAPKINATGYYRMLLPSIELSKTKRFKTHLLGMHPLDFNKPFEIAEIPLLAQWIEWADYMIFPMLTTDYSYVIKACKAINPDLELVMDVDQSLHFMDKDDPMVTKITGKMLDHLDQNMNLMDVVTSHNEQLLDFYESIMTTRYANSHTFFAHVPNPISKIGYEGITSISKNTDASIRIGMVGSVRMAKDLVLLKATLESLQAAYPSKLTFVMLGWDGIMQDGSAPLKAVAMEYHPSVGFTKYFEKLRDLQLDIALIPMRNTAYRRFASDIQYLEFAAQKIPVIASKKSVYADVITDGETGLLAHTDSQWKAAIRKLIEDSEFRMKLAANALEELWKLRSYSGENITFLSEIFV